MSLDLAALHAELVNDPNSLGYSSHVATGDDVGLASLLNTVSSSITITPPTISKDELMLACSPALFVLPTLIASLQTKWIQIFESIRAFSGTISLTDSRVIAIVSAAVTDGLLTAGQASVIGQRSGSRAEQLFGAGVVLTALQVEAARKGNY